MVPLHGKLFSAIIFSKLLSTFVDSRVTNSCSATCHYLCTVIWHFTGKALAIQQRIACSHLPLNVLHSPSCYVHNTVVVTNINGKSVWLVFRRSWVRIPAGSRIFFLWIYFSLSQPINIIYERLLSPAVNNIQLLNNNPVSQPSTWASLIVHAASFSGWVFQHEWNGRQRQSGGVSEEWLPTYES